MDLDFIIDQECNLNNGEQLLYSTKQCTAIPISAETTAGVRTFAIAESNGTICIRQKKLVETVIKDERGTVFSSTEGLIKGIQKIEERTGLLVADPLVSVNQGKNCLYLLNMLSEAINIYYDKKVVHYTNLRNQSQLNGLFDSKEQHATLNDAHLSSKEIKKVQIMFDKHNRFFSRSSTDLG